MTVGLRTAPPFGFVGAKFSGEGDIALLEFFYHSATNRGPGGLAYNFDASIIQFPDTAFRGKSLVAPFTPIINNKTMQPLDIAAIKNGNNMYAFPAKKSQVQETTQATFTSLLRGLYYVQSSAGIITTAVRATGGVVVPGIINYTGTPGGEIDGTDENAVFGWLQEASQIAFGRTVGPFLEPLLITALTETVVPGASIVFTERRSIVAVFMNLARIKAQFPALLGQLKFRLFCFGTDGEELLEWTAALSTYRKPGAFSLDDSGTNYNVNPQNSDSQVDFKFVTNPPNSEIVTPPTYVDFTINLETLAITNASRSDAA